MKQETAQKAAKWWADQLRGTAKLDHGDPSPTGGMVHMLATILQETEKGHQNTEQIDAFERELATRLVEVEHSRFSLGVDYHPDRTLADAANRASFALGQTTLPWKTSMHIDGDRITVSCGYRAARKEI